MSLVAKRTASLELVATRSAGPGNPLLEGGGFESGDGWPAALANTSDFYAGSQSISTTHATQVAFRNYSPAEDWSGVRTFYFRRFLRHNSPGLHTMDLRFFLVDGSANQKIFDYSGAVFVGMTEEVWIETFLALPAAGIFDYSDVIQIQIFATNKSGGFDSALYIDELRSLAEARYPLKATRTATLSLEARRT